MGVLEVEHYADLLDWAMKNVGKEGPLYFDCGVIRHNHFRSVEVDHQLTETGTTDMFRIGQKGKVIELEDILATFSAVSNNELLREVTNSGGRTYDHEGFRVSSDGKTLKMVWGS